MSPYFLFECRLTAILIPLFGTCKILVDLKDSLPFSGGSTRGKSERSYFQPNATNFDDVEDFSDVFSSSRYHFLHVESLNGLNIGNNLITYRSFGVLYLGCNGGMALNETFKLLALSSRLPTHIGYEMGINIYSTIFDQRVTK